MGALITLALIPLLVIAVSIYSSITNKIKRDQAKNQNIDPIYEESWLTFCKPINSEYYWTIDGWFCYRLKKHRLVKFGIHPESAIQLNGPSKQNQLAIYAVIFRDRTLGRGITLIFPKSKSPVSDVNYNSTYFSNLLSQSVEFSFSSLEEAIEHALYKLSVTKYWSLMESENTKPWSDYCTGFDGNHYWTDDGWFCYRYGRKHPIPRQVIQMNGQVERVSDSFFGQRTFLPIYAIICGSSPREDVTLVMPKKIMHLGKATEHGTHENFISDSSTKTQFKFIEEAIDYAQTNFSLERKFLVEAGEHYMEDWER